MQPKTLSTPFLTLIFLLQFNLYAQSCLPDGITFNTQSQIDNFQLFYPYCTHIEGYVEITGDSIYSLSGLSQIDSIDGHLWIGNNNVITSLEGLEGLLSVGGSLSIFQNQQLIDITALQNITSAGWYLSVSNNHSLSSLYGLHNIENAENLSIYNNSSLKNLQGLDNLKIIEGGVGICLNDSLTSLEGLNKLDLIGGTLRIYENASLIDISALMNLDTLHKDLSIQGNAKLPNLSGLDNVKKIKGEMRIQSNSSLQNINALRRIKTIGTDVTDIVIIYANSALENLHGLDSLTRVEGGFGVSSNAISSLEGIENLSFVKMKFTISGNPHLKDLLPLKSLTHTIWVTINDNDSLKSLEGLENIPGSILQGLSIYGNGMLSYCHVKTVCEYLLDPFRPPWINNNFTGCNSVSEIEDSCVYTIIREPSLKEIISIYPNPAYSIVNISHPEEIELMNLEIYDVTGNQFNCRMINNEIDVSHLSTGIYTIKIKSNSGIVFKKLLKI